MEFVLPASRRFLSTTMVILGNHDKPLSSFLVASVPGNQKSMLRNSRINLIPRALRKEKYQ
ncbi:hypothetical protein C5167_043629 [Papaver somniferum]|uniref:Uncharacterized protein n=1 Tax=Papaver somniferum TaxID=3469 RepID=A0A4Y7L9S3_PAPSO|nr:hypothetical protein C5167_043629 [Papaver somniferum]